jgi:hypothetical protein
MPSSARKSQRTRREPRKEETTSTPIEEDPSPSRPAKRRKKEPLEETEEAPAGQAPAGDDELVMRIAQQLRASDEPVQASKDHANAIHEANSDGVQAYAKIAALDWTYYITKLVVNIGRAPEGASGDAKAGRRHDDGDDEEQIHIDLGPGKIVSRNHAAICFDSKAERWSLVVKGRNGVKVDGTIIKPSQGPHPLKSGEVLEIGGVEMMFVMPSEVSPLYVDDKILERCGIIRETPSGRESKPRRQPLTSQAPPEHKRPGTPPPSAPNRGASTLGRSPAISTPAPVMVGADGVDLSQDENQHIKPQFSYAQMITQAIINSPDGKLNLSGIYDYIMATYSYYRHQQAAGWQNSIRHNLSLNKSFEKVPRLTDEPGKGMKWQIVPEAKDEMVKGAWRIGRGGHRGSSAPSSPNQLNYITQGPRDMASRGTPTSRKRRGSLVVVSPPHDSFQSTPDPSTRRAMGGRSRLTADGSPLPRNRKKLPPSDPALSSFHPQSPTLTSSYFEGDGASFATPAQPRIHPKLAPPSTAQRPSQHMPTSSPAPFWKYADIGSTPLKRYEPSPSKAVVTNMPVVESSSPPRGNKSLPSSPTRPQAREEPPSEPEPEPESKPSELGSELPGETRNSKKQRPGFITTQGSEDEEEEGVFDLTKGFQSIGSYHKHGYEARR